MRSNARINSFSFMENFYVTLSGLPDDVRLRLYDSIMRFMFYGEPLDLEPLEMAIIQALMPSLQKSLNMSRKKCGEDTEPNETNQNQSKPNETKCDETRERRKEKQETRNEKQETGNEKQETGNENPENSKPDGLDNKSPFIPLTDARGNPEPRAAGKKTRKKVVLTDNEAMQMIDERGFALPVLNRVKEWFVYKTERNDTYTPTGFGQFLTQVQTRIDQHGERAVCDVIGLSMSNNWQGVIWDKLTQGGGSRAAPFNPTDYLLSQIEAEVSSV